MENLSLFKVSNKEMLKRFKTWLWYMGMVVVAGAINFLVANLADLNIPTWLVVPVGLLLAQISKQVSENLKEMKGFAARGMGQMGKKTK